MCGSLITGFIWVFEVVCDRRPPPAWVYASYRFYVGPSAFRPRDFRRVDAAWVAEADLAFPF